LMEIDYSIIRNDARFGMGPRSVSGMSGHVMCRSGAPAAMNETGVPSKAADYIEAA